MLRPGERNRLEEGINYFPAGAPRRTLFFTLKSPPFAFSPIFRQSHVLNE